MRQYSLSDRILCQFDKFLKTAIPAPIIKTDVPSPVPNHINSIPLSLAERQHSAQLMRINHSGEICAQALYLGQTLTARNQQLAAELSKAAKEEETHLNWCTTRIQELGGRQSFLNPFWAIGSFAIGSLAGLMGDKVSLGFLAETEQQVTRHLEDHLKEISINDQKSRAILNQMRIDEQKHAGHAFALGGITFPKMIKSSMALLSKMMTVTSRYI